MAVRVVNVGDLKDLAGQELGVTDYLAVTQERIDKFADATEDHQWIHVDTERAKKESPYGGTIAHGFLSLSLISHLTKHVLQVSGVRMGINYGLDRVRFPSAVPSGSRIRARVVLQTAEDIKGGVQLTLGVTVECEGSSKPSCVAEWLLRYYI